MVAIPLFDARNYDPSTSLEPLPEGWVTRIFTASDLKPTKKNDGKFLELTCKVIHAENTALIGRTFIERLNVINPSAQAVEIANKQLSAICHVTGVFQVTDTAQLHNIPHRVRLSVTLGEDKRNADGTITPGKPIGNNVEEYADANGNPPMKAGSGPAMGAPQQTPPAQPPTQQPAAAGWGGASPAQQPAQQPAAAAWGGAVPQQPAPPAQPAQQPSQPQAWGGAPQQPAPAAWGGAPQR